MENASEEYIHAPDVSSLASDSAYFFDSTAILIPEATLPAWISTHQLAFNLLHLDDHSSEIVIDKIKQQKERQSSRSLTSETEPTLSGFLKDTFSFPPLNKERLHCQAGMQEENQKMLLALVGSTSPLNVGARLLRTGELPEFGELISGAGMNADVYAFGENQVVKFVRYGAEAAKLLADSINKLANDPRLKDIVLPVDLLKEGGAHLLQDRIPIHRYINPAQQDKFDALVMTAREILDIPNHGADKSIYVGKFRLIIDTQPTNMTEKMQWFDPVYMSIKLER